MIEDTRTADIAAAYRKLADLIEQVPEFGEVFSDTETIHVYAGDAKTLAAIARGIPGRVNKEANENYYGFTADLGGGRTLNVFSTRERVCERVVVGTETVETQVEIEPAKTETKLVEREVVEWRCEPLLSKVV